MLLQHSRVFSEQHGVIRPGLPRLSIVSCSILLGFCSTILIARILGPAAFGSYAFVLWLATVAVPIIGVGMSTLTSRHVAEMQSCETPRLAAGIFYFVWQRQSRIILLYCLIYLLLIYPFSWFFGTNAPVSLLLLAGLSAPPLLLSGVANITLRSLRRFDLLVSIQFVGAVAMLLLVMVIKRVQGDPRTGFPVWGTGNPQGVPLHIQNVGAPLAGATLLASAAASIFMLTIALICIVRLLPLREALPPGPFLKDRLTRGMSNSLLLFTLDAIVWQRSEMILLAHWSSAGGASTTPTDLGFYALGSMISVGIMHGIPALLSTCLLPLLLRYVPGQHYVSAADAYRKTMRSMTLLALPLCSLAILYCPFIITVCFGTAYLPVVTPLRILLVPAAVGSISTVSLTYLANGERKRAQVRLGACAAVLNLILALPFIALWGVTGAALACAIAQMVSAVGVIVIGRRLTQKDFL